MICCPDNAVPITTKSPPISIISSASKANLPPLSDLNTIQNHPNLNLINHKKCGSSSVNRIVGGTKAELGEFPWM